MENKEFETVETVEVETPVVEEAAPAKKKANVLAILALVAGILGIVFICCCNYLTPVFGLAAIILGAVSPKEENGKKNGMAIAGIVCAIAGIVLVIAYWVIMIVFPTALAFLSEAQYY